MRKNTVYTLLLIFLIAVFLVSAFFLVRYFVASLQQKQQFHELAQIVAQAQQSGSVSHKQEQTDSTASTEQTPTEPTSPFTTITDLDTGEKREILRKYAQLYILNSDLIGWMQIEGTSLNYPVMQTPDRPNYYLKRDFYKDYSAHGGFYAREECSIDPASDNITIYGHNMRDGSMMAVLHKYKDPDFFQKHPVIQFDTLTQENTYEILSVFLTTASVGEGFSYHDFINAYSEDAFDSFVSTCKRLSLYDTGINAQYGDKLITLSTCEYSQTNGRLVVVARRVTSDNP